MMRKAFSLLVCGMIAAVSVAPAGAQTRPASRPDLSGGWQLPPCSATNQRMSDG